MVFEGLIVKGIGGFYYVKTNSGHVVECRAAGRFRKEGLTPSVGDRAVFKRSNIEKSDEYGLISEIKERKNIIKRPPIANIDTLFIVISTESPPPNLLLIDKVSAVATLKDIDVKIVINKTDLSGPERLLKIYSSAGFETVCASAATGEGIGDIKSMLSKGLSAFTGNSGVGKSSILNLVAPGINMQTGEVSDKLGRGRHTTRHVEIFEIKEGVYIADTPGFSSFEIDKEDKIDPGDLELGFIEFSEYLGLCRFSGCSHKSEPDCAVLDALKVGKIEKSRHDSYLKMYDDLKALKLNEYR